MTGVFVEDFGTPGGTHCLNESRRRKERLEVVGTAVFWGPFFFGIGLLIWGDGVDRMRTFSTWAT
jgi:hypothetical protein